ncbi:hypothetical protein HRbin40_01899 [bacterium HR40]|nr:hypothetical protein HRbin40_01899 [bacterium HR40]
MTEDPLWVQHPVLRGGRELAFDPETATADPLAACLAEIGLSASDVATARARSEREHEAMMRRFGIHRRLVPRAFLGALRDAERVCAHCLAVRRCRRFLAHPDAPAVGARAFCPNAALFAQIATVTEGMRPPVP